MKLVQMMLIGSVLLFSCLFGGAGLAQDSVPDAYLSFHKEVLEFNLQSSHQELELYNPNLSIVNYSSDIDLFVSPKFVSQYTVGVKYLDFSIEDELRESKNISNLWVGLQFVF